MRDEDVDDDGWISMETDMPDLETEEGRDSWVEILAAQDDESLQESDMSWIKCLNVEDGKTMIVRMVYADGSEEIFDTIIRRKISVVKQGDGESN